MVSLRVRKFANYALKPVLRSLGEGGNFLTNKLTKGWLKMKRLVMAGLIGMIMLAGSVVIGGPSLTLLTGTKNNEYINSYKMKTFKVPIKKELDSLKQVGAMVVVNDPTTPLFQKIDEKEKNAILRNKVTIGKGAVRMWVDMPGEGIIPITSPQIKLIYHKIMKATYSVDKVLGEIEVTVSWKINFRSPDAKDIKRLIVNFLNPDGQLQVKKGSLTHSESYRFEVDEDYDKPSDLISTWSDDVQSKKKFKKIKPPKL